MLCTIAVSANAQPLRSHAWGQATCAAVVQPTGVQARPLQFEAKKMEVPRGGVIIDPLIHATVIGRFLKWAGESKIRVRNLTNSGILGDKGNREFLLHLEP